MRACPQCGPAQRDRGTPSHTLPSASSMGGVTHTHTPQMRCVFLAGEDDPLSEITFQWEGAPFPHPCPLPHPTPSVNFFFFSGREHPHPHPPPLEISFPHQPNRRTLQWCLFGILEIAEIADISDQASCAKIQHLIK